MLELPKRGDVIARGAAVIGVVIYAMLAFVFVGTLLGAEDSVLDSLRDLVGLGTPKNYAVTVLVLGGLATTVVAMGYVFADIRKMRPEEEDIDWVHEYRREGIMLVFVARAERKARFAAGKRQPEEDESVTVETLVDDRVRRTNAALTRTESASVSPEEFRVLAEQRTARWGGVARYASSLLLLLAVLGTFAGVKTALPGLIRAVGSTDPNVQTSIVEPLRAVSEAFGGNALALIGAIALGFMAQGIAIGRRHLLERLELVSTEHIYRDQGISAANPLESAVHALKRTADEIKASNGALLGIEGGLETLGSDFRKSFAELERALTEVASRHESDLYDKTGQALHALHGKVAELSAAVAANASVYSGLVDRVGERTNESREAMVQMKDANASLARAMNDVIQLGEQSRRTFAELDHAAKTLAGGTTEVKTQLVALTTAVQEAQPAMRQLDGSLGTVVSRIEEVEQRAADSWRVVGEEVRRQLAAISQGPARADVVAPRDERASGAAPMSPEALALLRRIADGVGNRPAPASSAPSVLVLALVPALSLLVGAGLVYFLLRLL
ncbi:MAG: hypothetical protein WKG32_14525 [Gemmatimonadaceae bacterium]